MTFIDKNCWDLNDLKTYFTTESRGKQKEAFNKTHLPIDEIKVVKKPLNISKDFINEEEFLNDIILESEINDPKRTFVLEGQTGSGKSELCQEIQYQLEDITNRIPILFSRTNTSIKQIFNKLSQHTGTDYQLEEDLGIHKIENLLRFLKSECYLYIEKEERKDKDKRFLNGAFLKYFEKIFQKQDFLDIISDNLREFQQSNEKLLKLYDPIKESQLDNIITSLELKLSGNQKDDLNEKIRHVLNKFFIEKFGSKEDLDEILLVLSNKCIGEDKRVILIFEDITSMGIYKEQILRFTFDKGEDSGRVDIILGVTTGFAKDQLKIDTHIDRIDGYFSLTSEDGEHTYFLEKHPENIIKLALKYLTAIKDCKQCTEINDCFETFGDYLFPFTEESLMRIYHNLIDKNNPKRTPRLLLEKVMLRILNDRKFPFEKNIFIKEISGYFLALKLRDHPDFIKLFNIFGNEVEPEKEIFKYLCVPKGILKFFNLELNSTIKNELDIIEKNDKLCIKTKVKKGRTVRKTKWTKTKGDNDIDQEEKRFALSEEFSKWMTDESELFNDNYLREGLTSVLTSRYDFKDLKISSKNPKVALSYKYSGKLPMKIEDIGGSARGENIIRLYIPKRSNEEILELSFDFGIDPIFEDFDSLVEERLKSRYQLIDWIDVNYQKYRKKLRKKVEDHLEGLSIETITIFMKCVIQNILYGKDMLDFNSIFEDLSNLKFPVIHEHCTNITCEEYLPDIMCLKCYHFSNPPLPPPVLKDLETKIKYFEGFFKILFSLGKDVINYNTLQEEFLKYKNNFDDIVKKIDDAKNYSKIHPNIFIYLSAKDSISIKKLIEFFFNFYFKFKRRLTNKKIRENLVNTLELLSIVSQYKKDFSKSLLKIKITELEKNLTDYSWKQQWEKTFRKLNACDFDKFFKLIDSNIEFIKKIQSNSDITIFNVSTFINNIAIKIALSDELMIFNTLNEIFTIFERHQRVLSSSTYSEKLESLECEKNGYLNLLSQVREEIDGI